ncbi:hypothetical protein MRB53_005991 [Persea americana]|uniref:Uncharacterized protein n=1 Tax=Persea americana TaxID=3435 RepID=A0ACC2MF69_PERAE|nr:hypothetical protein MRB53_005991 [Persea americana]
MGPRELTTYENFKILKVLALLFADRFKLLNRQAYPAKISQSCPSSIDFIKANRRELGNPARLSRIADLFFR